MESCILTRIDVYTLHHHILPYLSLRELNKLVIIGNVALRNRIDQQGYHGMDFSTGTTIALSPIALPHLPKCVNGAALFLGWAPPLHQVPTIISNIAAAKMESLHVLVNRFSISKTLALLPTSHLTRLSIKTSDVRSGKCLVPPIDARVVANLSSVRELELSFGRMGHDSYSLDDLHTFANIALLQSLHLKNTHIKTEMSLSALITPFKALHSLQIQHVNISSIVINDLPPTLTSLLLHIETHTCLVSGILPPNLTCLSLIIPCMVVAPPTNACDVITKCYDTIISLSVSFNMTFLVDRLFLHDNDVQPGLRSLKDLTCLTIFNVDPSSLALLLQSLPQSCQQLTIHGNGCCISPSNLSHLNAIPPSLTRLSFVQTPPFFCPCFETLKELSFKMDCCPRKQDVRSWLMQCKSFTTLRLDSTKCQNNATFFQNLMPKRGKKGWFFMAFSDGSRATFYNGRMVDKVWKE